MRATLFGLAWLFVFAAAVYDCHFAWQNRAVLQEWEENPLARWAAPRLGLKAFFLFKFAGLAFAAGLAAYCRRRVPGRALTIIVTSVYALLSLHYFVDHTRGHASAMASLATPVQRAPSRPGLLGQ